MNTLLQIGELVTPLMRNAFNVGYIIGLLIIPITLIIVIVATIIVGKRKRNKNTEEPRAEKAIKKELREILNSGDGKVRGMLLAWCVLTGTMIALDIIFGGNELSNWINAGFLLALLIMSIRGRGSRYLIFVIAGLLAVFLFWDCATTTGASLKSNCYLSDWVADSLCHSVPDSTWEDRAKLTRISDAIMGSYYAITALYFGFSKRVKRHFAWGKRQAELWLELEKRDNLGKAEAQINSKPRIAPEASNKQEDDESDIEEQLRKLRKQSEKLANKIDRLEKRRVEQPKKIDNTNDYYDDL